MYETIAIFCPNCGQQQPSVYLDSVEKSNKRKAMFRCCSCKCSILLTKDITGDFNLSVKQFGHYKINIQP